MNWTDLLIAAAIGCGFIGLGGLAALSILWGGDATDIEGDLE